VHSWNTFSVTINHKQTQIHKTHHGPDLGETTTFPLYSIFWLVTGLASKWHFVPGLPSASPKIPKVGTPTTLGAHNFVCNLWLRWGLKQGNRGDSRLLVVSKLGLRPFFFTITCVSDVQMGHRAHFKHLRSKIFPMI
jgi:hypothetical protein